jgi:hypothetical protein
MTTKEKINENPFNSDYEEKLLLDKLMATPSDNEYMFISQGTMFTHIHGMTHYGNICKIATDENRNQQKSFKQKLMVTRKVKERGITCLLRR